MMQALLSSVCACACVHVHVRMCLSVCVIFPSSAAVKERWQLTQEWSRLQAQQTAFDQERQVSLKNMEQEREDLQKGKVSPPPSSLLPTPSCVVCS